MKCFELQGPDDVEGLRLVDKPTPKPGPGRVLVRVKAATLNYRDLLTIKGGYASRQKFPLIPVSDGAGVVEAVGSDVREFAPGDRVNALVPSDQRLSRRRPGDIQQIKGSTRHD